MTNPLCHCGKSSKRQISGPDKSIGRQVHYVCRVGGCDFYCAHRNALNQKIALESDLVEPMARLGIIYGNRDIRV